MSIKSMMTPSLLAATVIMSLFHASKAGAADWSEDSNGYTLNCDIKDIGYAYGHIRGQWQTFEARFSLPADTGAKLWYGCRDGGGKTPLKEPAYDFYCEVRVEHPGSSLYVSRAPDEIHIKDHDLVPGYISPRVACKTVAETANLEVRKRGK